MIIEKRRGVRQNSMLALVLAWLLVASCSSDNEKIVSLGSNYHLFVFTGEARIENMSSTNAIPIPHRITEIGWNDNFIVVRASEPGAASDLWIISKAQQAVSGPFTQVELEEHQKTNSALRIRIAPIEKIRN
jgi:hypothetical protein